MATTTQRTLRGVGFQLNKHPSSWDRADRIFSGWNTHPDGSGTPYDDEQTDVKLLQDTTLYAMWEDVSWAISYDMNGHGVIPEEAQRDYISKDLPYIPPSPDRDSDYIFSHWIPPSINEGETGDKSFQANWVYVPSTIPGFLTVVLLDTSGSMGATDYGKCAQSIFLSQNEYLCSLNAYAKTAIYHGTDISDIQTSGEVEELDVTNSTWISKEDFYNKIRVKIKDIDKAGGGEYMLLCLYYTIDDIITKYIQSPQFTIGGSPLRGINFLILSDEPVFTSSSITSTQYDELVTPDRCPWIYNWQNSAATCKFPTSGTDITSSTKSKIASDMVNIFKQISYYYGVNMTFGMSSIVSLEGADGDIELMRTERKIPYITNVYRRPNGEIIKVKTVDGVDEVNDDGSTRNIITVKSSNGSTTELITTNAASVNIYGDAPGELHDAQVWILPDGIAEPTSPMIKISYYNVEFNNGNIMVPDDLYSSDNKNKIHHVNGTYFQFRFYGEKITLPTKSMVVNGNNLIGWKIVGDEEEVTYAPGQEIPQGEDKALYNDITLIAQFQS